jgi:hypothetical protein
MRDLEVPDIDRYRHDVGVLAQNPCRQVRDVDATQFEMCAVGSVRLGEPFLLPARRGELPRAYSDIESRML